MSGGAVLTIAWPPSATTAKRRFVLRLTKNDIILVLGLTKNDISLVFGCLVNADEFLSLFCCGNSSLLMWSPSL